MPKAKIVLDNDFTVAATDPRVFGGFAEHLGRCIYGGIYEPGHATATPEGFRKDVIEMVRELNMPVMRYPGGNFVSGYNWEDGVGPRDKRPRRIEPAWRSVEPNTFGTNEFIDWCKMAGTSPMMAVNLGTRGPVEARDLVEYCNMPGGTHFSDMRREHGYEDPHGVKLWCLGNEMDGAWQMGHKKAPEYARVATEAARLMKMVDPEIEIVACGSTWRGMPTFPDWEAEVLAEAFELVDYVSIHTYLGNKENDTTLYLARTEEMNAFIHEVTAACDFVSAKKRSPKRIMLSYDEWNVWFHSHGEEETVEPWSEAPPILEDTYNMEDALVVGSMLITLMNNADRVKIGCLAQVVNVIAPIMTETGGETWKQTIFHPFMQASRYGRGIVLQQKIESDTYDCEQIKEVSYLTSTCVFNPDNGELTVFAVNRCLDKPLDLDLTLRAFPQLQPSGWDVLQHPDLKATNTRQNPKEVTPETTQAPEPHDGEISVQLPPASWNVIRYEAKG